MKLFAPLALAFALAACAAPGTPAPTPAQAVAQVEQVGCQVDGKFVPLAQNVVAAAVPLVTAANAPAGAAVVAAGTVDALLLHPTIVAACAALNAAAVPVAVPVTPAS